MSFHGYLECRSLLKNREISLKDYYLNRFKKIYLPLVIVTFVTVIIVKLIPTINWFNLKPETSSVLFGYNNFWQIGANLDYFARHNNSPFMHFWYISILIQFDIIFPILFVILKKINRKIKSFSIIAISIITIISICIFIFMCITNNINIVYYNTFARIFSILFGVSIALINFKYENKIINKINDKIMFLIYIVLLTLLTLLISSESSLCAFSMILVSLISCRIIDYSTLKKDNREDSNKLIKVFAKISYEVYLIQYPVIFLFNYTNIPDVIKTILIIIVTLLLSFALHLFLYFDIRNKIIKIVKYIILCAIIITGSLIVIIEKDNTSEMKELEEKLSANERILEEKQNDGCIVVEIDEQQENANNEKDNTYVATVEETVKNLQLVGIGDSVLLGVSDELYEVFPNGYFDGKVSRNLTAGMEILENMINERKIR